MTRGPKTAHKAHEELHERVVSHCSRRVRMFTVSLLPFRRKLVSWGDDGGLLAWPLCGELHSPFQWTSLGHIARELFRSSPQPKDLSYHVHRLCMYPNKRVQTGWLDGFVSSVYLHTSRDFHVLKPCPRGVDEDQCRSNRVVSVAQHLLSIMCVSERNVFVLIYLNLTERERESNSLFTTPVGNSAPQNSRRS